MPQKEDKAQESRDKLGHLGHSGAIKVTPDSKTIKCSYCRHDCCKNAEEKITVENALQLLTQDIPQALHNLASGFACYHPFMRILDKNSKNGAQKVQELLRFSADRRSPLLWEVKILITSSTGSRTADRVAGAHLNILYPGNTLTIYSRPMDDKREEIKKLLYEGKLLPKDVVTLHADILNLIQVKFGIIPGVRTDWKYRIKNRLKELLCEETGLTPALFDIILDYAYQARITDLERDNYQKGLQKAVKGLEDSKSFTKSPQLKELREELEEILHYRVPRDMVFGD